MNIRLQSSCLVLLVAAALPVSVSAQTYVIPFSEIRQAVENSGDSPDSVIRAYLASRIRDELDSLGFDLSGGLVVGGSRVVRRPRPPQAEPRHLPLPAGRLPGGFGVRGLGPERHRHESVLQAGQGPLRRAPPWPAGALPGLRHDRRPSLLHGLPRDGPGGLRARSQQRAAGHRQGAAPGAGGSVLSC